MRFVLGAAMSVCSFLPSALAQQLPEIGKVPPALAIGAVLNAPDGAKLDWESLKGRVVVLEFFGTWCAGCIHYLPEANKLHDAFSREQLAYIFVTNERRESIDKFLKESEVKPVVVLDREGETTATYSPGMYPTAVLVDITGTIVAVTHPKHITEDIIRRLLAGKSVDLPITDPYPNGDPNWDRATNFDGDDPGTLSQVIIRQISKRRPAVRFGNNSGRIVADGVSFARLVALAYDVHELHVSTPLATDQFYRVSVMAADRSDTTAKQMLREALERTFRYRVASREIEHEVIALRRVAGAPLKLKTPTPGLPGGGTWNDEGTVDLDNTEMSFLLLVIDLKEYNLGAKWLLDETGIQDKYRIKFKYTPGDKQSLVSALRELGLEVVKENRTLRMLTLEPVRATASSD